MSFVGPGTFDRDHQDLQKLNPFCPKDIRLVGMWCPAVITRQLVTGRSDKAGDVCHFIYTVKSIKSESNSGFITCTPVWARSCTAVWARCCTPAWGPSWARSCTPAWALTGTPAGAPGDTRGPELLRILPELHWLLRHCFHLDQSCWCFLRYRLLHRKAGRYHRPRRRRCCTAAPARSRRPARWRCPGQCGTAAPGQSHRLARWLCCTAAPGLWCTE